MKHSLLSGLVLVYLATACFLVNCEDPRLLLVSIATDPEHPGLKRFEKSLQVLNYSYEIFGMGEEWKGGDIKYGVGGGQKINIMKRGIEQYKEDENLVVIFTDAYDVIALEPPAVVLKKFMDSGAKVIFSAERSCWPMPDLEGQYPEVGENEERFLNSGAYMGYITDLYDIIHMAEIDDTYDDQLYYTWLFLNEPTRNKHRMRLDTRSDIFLNMNGLLDEMKMEQSADGEGRVEWVVTKPATSSRPSFIHANGPTKLYLNSVGNYIGNTYSPEDCTLCSEKRIELDSDQSKWPDVTIGVFIVEPTPFLREYLEKLSKLDYPKDKITLLIYNNIEMHNEVIEAFFVKPENEYLQIKYIGPKDDFSEQEARNEAMQECIDNNCSYYLYMSSIVHLDNPKTLQILIRENREVITPIMTKPGTVWANVWGAINKNFYYKRSPDYVDIISGKIKGVFNVPYVGEIILHKGSTVKKIGFIYENNLFELYVLYATIMREKDIWMYATNTDYFGHVIETDNFDPKLIRPEMFEIFKNFQDWTARYIHPEYTEFLANTSKIQEPCVDVFWFPIVNDEFCDDLVTMMEHFGEWSGGRDNYYDKRLAGKKEAVPTVDIHMNQVGWDKHWLHFLEMFVMPMQKKIFPGYGYKAPRADLSFVVRYKLGEQEFLKPHNDHSTYTINIALNRPGVDFHGGGCRFVRRNCSITSTKKGWVTLHPGRLTHYHEGLKITNGTRYIMVTFVDP